MKVFELCQAIEESYNEFFPSSAVCAALHKNLYRSIDVNCKLAGSKDECINNYWENDMFSIRFRIDGENGQLKGIDEESELPEMLVLQIENKSFTTKPENNYMAYGRIVLPFRKVKGDANKIFNTLEKYFSKLHDEVENALNNDLIHDNFKTLVIEKLQ
ncbi:MAG: hypothetical protein ACRDD7_08480 [Peptostreptococcaceae bacterium]